MAAGADVNELSEGDTPIVAACLSDKLRAGAALMKMGADATKPGTLGFTPLQIAAMKGHAKIVKMLLRYNVDTSEMHSDGLSPFHRACRGSEIGHTDAVFAFLDAGVPPDQPSSTGETPMQMAGNDNTRKLLAEALQEQRRQRR